MSKATALKLNLQIRSASFKESSHAGAGIENKTPSSKMQLPKVQWKSEDNNAALPKTDGKVIAKKSSENIVTGAKTDRTVTGKKSSEYNVTGTKGVHNADEAKIETQSNAVTAALGNDLKSISKKTPGIKYVPKVVSGSASKPASQKGSAGSSSLETKDKNVANERAVNLTVEEEKLFADANSKVKMKTESQNNATASVFKTNSSPVCIANSRRIDDEKKMNSGSLSIKIPQKSRKDKDMYVTTIKSENQSSSSLKVEIPSQSEKNSKEIVSDFVNVPYSNSPTNMIEPSPDVSDMNKADSDTDNKEVKVSNNITKTNLETAVSVIGNNDNTQFTEVKESISRSSSTNKLLEVKESISRNSSANKLLEVKGNLSKSSSNTKLKLPDNRKASDDPETVIAELEAYLREKFGSVVDETYTQVGETDTVSDTRSSSFDPEGATCLSFPSETDSDKLSQISSPVSTPTSTRADRRSEAFIPHPIFFKTSIKKDPGSKLHDALVSELSSVLKKKDDPNGDSKETNKNESTKSDSDKSKFPRRRISAKGNKVFGNKALIQHLEDHLTRTLHKNKIFQRQSLKVLGLDTIEIKQENKTEEQNGGSVPANVIKGVIPPAPVPPPVPHYGAVPLHIFPKTTEKDNKNGDRFLDSKIEASEAKSDTKIDVKHNSVSVGDKESILNEISAVDNEETGESRSAVTKDDELLIYTYEHPSGRTEGIVCSVKTDENQNSTGTRRKYVTCVNIVAEKPGNIKQGFTQICNPFSQNEVHY